MELPEQAFTDPDVALAWLQGLRHTLHDRSRAALDRVEAGCSQVYVAMLEDGADIPARGAVPAGLPADLHERWRLAFDTDADVDERLAAVLYVSGRLDGADLARMGDEILRREFGA